MKRLVLFLALAGCAAEEGTPPAPPPALQEASAEQALALFAEACLDTGPGFGGASEVFATAGLAAEGEGRWANRARNLAANLASTEVADACIVSFVATDLALLRADLDRLIPERYAGAASGQIEGTPAWRLPGTAPGTEPIFVRAFRSETASQPVLGLSAVVERG
ncbi:MAG: hypothetical protein AAGI34_06955 [Pseudomonadota bacterium]